MIDTLFVLALVVPPLVVVACFALLAIPVRREQGIGQFRVHAH